eukprot:CAMPEP_0170452736 /NCGR_PEP_ID=MMETSP0123-20130129/1529_1 /TAXON_ID=182087 /ORGANISM="Favella ehrenbergii, Strain Fehren 1" /LENGTH=69 /DNA_ID=CAMNT_0010714829 /DNA_START=1302 /DNA_END=1511 /DNA_ORIENTATION=-
MIFCVGHEEALVADGHQRLLGRPEAYHQAKLAALDWQEHSAARYHARRHSGHHAFAVHHLAGSIAPWLA